MCLKFYLKLIKVITKNFTSNRNSRLEVQQLVKNKVLAQMFSSGFLQNFYEHLFYKTPSAAASEVSLYSLKKKPQQNRIYNLELRNFNFNLFFTYFKSLKDSCIFGGKSLKSKFLFSFVFCLLVVC